MKTLIIIVLLAVVVVIGVSICAGCGGDSGTKGTFQSVNVSMSLDTAVGGGGGATYGGTIGVKLDDGTSVDVACPEATAMTLKGGQTVTIKKDSSGNWTFVSAD
jgi:hypothetical protein